MPETEQVALYAAGTHIAVYRYEDALTLGVPHEVPADLVDAYERAHEQLDQAREAIVVAAGYDPDLAWEQLMDEQAEQVNRWHDEQEGKA